MAATQRSQSDAAMTEVAETTPWMYYTIKALAQWLEYDKPGGRALRSDDLPIVRRWMAFYRIARNFPGLGDDNVLRTLLVDVLAATKRIKRAGAQETQLVQEVQRIATSHGQKQLISAASKLLFLACPERCVIYDRNARTALGLRQQATYERYVLAWNTSLAECRPQIEGAIQRCLELPDKAFPLCLADSSTCRSALSEPWFHRRVFDIHLWHSGDREWKPPAPHCLQ